VDRGRYVSNSADSVAERARFVAAASMIRPAAVVLTLSAGGVRAAAAAVSCTPSRKIKCLLFTIIFYTRTGSRSVATRPLHSYRTSTIRKYGNYTVGRPAKSKFVIIYYLATFGRLLIANVLYSCLAPINHILS